MNDTTDKLNPYHMTDNEAVHYARLREDPWCGRLLEVLDKYRFIVESARESGYDEDLY